MTPGDASNARVRTRQRPLCQECRCTHGRAWRGRGSAGQRGQRGAEKTRHMHPRLIRVVLEQPVRQPLDRLLGLLLAQRGEPVLEAAAEHLLHELKLSVVRRLARHSLFLSGCHHDLPLNRVLTHRIRWFNGFVFSRRKPTAGPFRKNGEGRGRPRRVCRRRVGEAQ